jgi:hypothetical protein
MVSGTVTDARRYSRDGALLFAMSVFAVVADLAVGCDHT